MSKKSKIISLIKDGETDSIAIAKKVNCSRQYVWGLMKKQPKSVLKKVDEKVVDSKSVVEKSVSAKSKRHVWSKKEIADMTREHKQDKKTHREIGATRGISGNRVCQLINKSKTKKLPKVSTPKNVLKKVITEKVKADYTFTVEGESIVVRIPKKDLLKELLASVLS
jgi:hypothetical protein